MFLLSLHSVFPRTNSQQNAQTNFTSSNNTNVTTTSVNVPISSSNYTMSKNPFRNPEPFNGPWPECLGWDANDCASYIKLLAPDVDNVPIIVPPDIKGGKGGSRTDIHRVYILVDEYGVVCMNPHRA